MKKIILYISLCSFMASMNAANLAFDKPITLSMDVIKDKIKGGWAGQTIGCTYGGPTEFKYRGAMIHDQTPIIWYDDYLKDTFAADPGLYDDVYMDMTFVQVIDRLGLDAPVDSFALAFANENYKLWHANQAARYNILKGIMPPASGNWINNPHADDIDFQIESDFIGLMCPGMLKTASTISDRIGHIMNYGDGWYGGVYTASLYSLAFISNDIPEIVSEALKSIPPKSKFRLCIEDVIRLHKEYPTDWRRCWFEVEKNHSFEIGCPEGVFNAFDIDATLNSAYVTMGLLYGEGDFYKTMDITTRSGQDSDSNPAVVAGIWGAIFGYSKIPDYWKKGYEKIEQVNFPYTKITLSKVYAMNLKNLRELVLKNGGKADATSMTLIPQRPVEVRWEQSFTGHFPTERRVINKEFHGEPIIIHFDGNAIVVMGSIKQLQPDNSNYVATLEAWIDGKKVDTFKMPFDYIKRKYDIFYTYNLENGPHSLEIKWMNPHDKYDILTKDAVIYSNKARTNVRLY